MSGRLIASWLAVVLAGCDVEVSLGRIDAGDSIDGAALDTSTADAPPDVPVDAWAGRALEEGALVLQPGKQFVAAGRAPNTLRLGFAQHDAAEAEEAVRRMVATIPTRQRPRRA